MATGRQALKSPVRLTEVARRRPKIYAEVRADRGKPYWRIPMHLIIAALSILYLAGAACAQTWRNITPELTTQRRKAWTAPAAAAAAASVSPPPPPLGGESNIEASR